MTSLVAIRTEAEHKRARGVRRHLQTRTWRHVLRVGRRQGIYGSIAHGAGESRPVDILVLPGEELITGLVDVRVHSMGFKKIDKVADIGQDAIHDRKVCIGTGAWWAEWPGGQRDRLFRAWQAVALHEVRDGGSLGGLWGRRRRLWRGLREAIAEMHLGEVEHIVGLGALEEDGL